MKTSSTLRTPGAAELPKLGGGASGLEFKDASLTALLLTLDAR